VTLCKKLQEMAACTENSARRDLDLAGQQRVADGAAVSPRVLCGGHQMHTVAVTMSSQRLSIMY
jgi:hypothetical protein